MSNEIGSLPPTMLISVGADSVAFAQVGAVPGDLTGVEEHRSGATATFTDAVIGYAARQDLQLRGCRLFISVAGVITDGMLRTTSGKWFISLEGLRAMTGIQPIVLNDVAAMAWATAKGNRGIAFGANITASKSHDGRHVFVFVGEQGLGAACADRRGVAFEVIDSEAGHLPFAAETEAEWQLARKVTVLRGGATYENTVASLTAGTLDQPIRGASNELDTLATIIGRYAASVTLAFAAWDGTVLCGAGFDLIRTAGKGAAFRKGFEGTGKMRSTLRNVPTLSAPPGTSALRGLSVMTGIEPYRSEPQTDRV